MHNKLCFMTSFIFLTNIYYSFVVKRYLYTILFGYLFVTSLIFHYQKYNIWLNILDKSAIGGILCFSIYNYFSIIYKNFKKIKKTFRSSTQKVLKKFKKNKHIQKLFKKSKKTHGKRKTKRDQTKKKPIRIHQQLFKSTTSYKNGLTLFILLCLPILFLFECYLFYYGYLNKKYCYHVNETIANMYHSLLHFIASISFHLFTYILSS